MTQPRAQIFVPLYKKRGYLRGTIAFDGDNIGDDFTATLDWEKPSLPKEKFYPLGFSTTATVHGQVYAPPPTGARALPGLNVLGQLRFELIEDGAPVVGGDSYWLANNQLNTAAFTAPRLVLKVNAKTGLISGSVFRAGLRPVSLPLKAVILQRTEEIEGLFFDRTDKTSGLFHRN